MWWRVVWDRLRRAARPLELYGGLEVEWTICQGKVPEDDRIMS